ncbi:MAG TPA: ATP-binding protein [Thermoanaerobaculia bacterium]|nr:ATP-binding protein [Thermoanaerobaculia bacterium]
MPRLLGCLLLLGGLLPGPLAGAADDGADGVYRDLLRGFRPNFHSYRTEDGLPQGTIECMARDRAGRLWVGTQSGAAHFDGHQWATVHMPNRSMSDYVLQIVALADGSLWFATEGGGLSRLADGAWTTFTRETSDLPGNLVRALLADLDGEGLWVGTDRGLARYQDGRFTLVPGPSSLRPSTPITALAQTRGTGGAAVLWVGTDGGLARLEGGRWRTFSEEERELPDRRIRRLLPARSADGAEALWIGLRVGLARYEHGRMSMVGLSGWDIQALLEVDEDLPWPGLWVGTGRLGVWRFHQGRWTQLATRAAGLPDDIVRSLLVTDTGPGRMTVWIGTYEGLVRHEEGPWIGLTPTNSALPWRVVMALLESKDGDRPVYWLGTWGGGLARYDGETWEVYQKASSSLPDDVIWSLAETRSPAGLAELWVGTQKGGMARLSGGRWQTFDTGSSALPSNAINALVATRDDAGRPLLWVGTDRGLVSHRDGRWEKPVTAPPGLLDLPILSLATTTTADGIVSLWIGTDGGGLVRLHQGTWSSFTTKTSPLPNDRIVSLLGGPAGQQELWVGSHGGAARLDLATGRWSRFAHDTSPALPDNLVASIQRDAAGRVYLFTNRGVARLEPAGSSYALRTFTSEDGLPHDELNRRASMVDRRGRIWAGTLGGAAVLDPRLGEGPLRELSLVVESITGASRGDAAGNLELEHGAGITFSYALVGARRARETVYRTQLVGLEPKPGDWTTVGRRELTRLPAGRYAFRVWAREPAGRVTAPASFELAVATPWWRRWWALALGLVAAAGLFLAAVKWLLRGAQRKEAQLAAAVRARTIELEEARRRADEASAAKSRFLSSMSHEIRTPLNSVIGVAGLLQDSNLPPEQRELVEIIRTGGEALVAIVDDVLDFSRIEAGGLELEEVAFDPIDCLDDAVELVALRASQKGLELGCRIEGPRPGRVLGDPARLRQVLLNLLSNAVKFTAAGKILVTVSSRPTGPGSLALGFTVADTGIGIPRQQLERLFLPFSQAETSTARLYGGTGLGLAICKSLIERMGGRIWAKSEPGQGSQFSIEVRLREAGDSPEPADRKLEPVAPDAAAGSWNEPTPGTVGRRLRVLVADDQPVNRKVITAMLARLGHAADEVADGREVVAALERRRYDLVLMDVQMPEMDGPEAASWIRREIPAEARPRVVAVTAAVTREDRQRCLAAGMDDFLAKPVTLEALARLLGSPGPGPLPGEPDGRGESSFDADQIASLRQLGQLDGGLELARVVTAFISRAPERLAGMRFAIARGDRERFRAEVHSLRGSAATLGARRLARICQDLEGDLERGSPTDELSRRLTSLEQELQQVVSRLPGALALDTASRPSAAPP